MSLSPTARLVVALFAVSGTTHLVRPQVFEPLMPTALPAHREIILASGAAELALGAGLLHPRTRRFAGYAAAALLVAVLPGNVKMAKDARRSRSRVYRLLTAARLPLQAPMVRAVLRAAREA